jgi:hypothetical protein
VVDGVLVLAASREKAATVDRLRTIAAAAVGVGVDSVAV